MHQSLELLMNEHRLIEKVLGSMTSFVARLESGEVDDARAQVARYSEFLREYADRRHHGKEEDRLFVAMGEHGFPATSGPVAVMLHEHELGRAHVRALVEVGRGSGELTSEEVALVKGHARDFINLLLNHIQKEDRILYPAADHSVPAEALDRLGADFDAQDRAGVDAGKRLQELAESLIAANPQA
jgi:hemerythrin-like domain-containing protein